MKIKQSVNKNAVNITLINYSDKNYTKAQKKNTKSAIKKGCFKKVISYSPYDIEESFYKENKDILDQKRGNGFWLWKPYFIKKTLESMDYGDLLFYCDSGSYFVNSIKNVIESVDQNQDVIPFELQQVEKKWTKKDCFILMDCDVAKYTDTKQRMGGYSLWRKSEFTMEFVSLWLEYGKNKKIISDLENTCGSDNFPEFQEHRHDQSIFSLLTKKKELIAYRDPSQFGNNYKEIHPASRYPQTIVSTRQRNLTFMQFLKKKIRLYLVKFRK